MISKKAISTDKAPKAASFFSQAILTPHNMSRLDISGQIGLDPEKGELVEGGITTETEQTFKNIESILKEVGWKFSNIVKVRVYLTSMDDYQEMNEIYATKFGDEPPARIAIAVKELPLGAQIEIECEAIGSIGFGQMSSSFFKF